MNFKTGIMAFKLSNSHTLNTQENSFINAIKVAYVGAIHKICHSNFRVLKATSQKCIQSIISNILYFTQCNGKNSFRKLKCWDFFSEISFLGGNLPAISIDRNLGFSFEPGFSKKKILGPLSDKMTEELFAKLKGGGSDE